MTAEGRKKPPRSGEVEKTASVRGGRAEVDAEQSRTPQPSGSIAGDSLAYCEIAIRDVLVRLKPALGTKGTEKVNA
jgi:hypothetical protein